MAVVVRDGRLVASGRVSEAVPVFMLLRQLLMQGPMVSITNLAKVETLSARAVAVQVRERALLARKAAEDHQVQPAAAVAMGISIPLTDCYTGLALGAHQRQQTVQAHQVREQPARRGLGVP